MLGYYKDEEATGKSFTEDGWFKSGDLGYLNKKGILYITGRVKNLIILANGKNVHPEELEEHLVRRISYIREVVVYAEVNEKGEGKHNICNGFPRRRIYERGWHGQSQADFPE